MSCWAYNRLFTRLVSTDFTTNVSKRKSWNFFREVYTGAFGYACLYGVLQFTPFLSTRFSWKHSTAANFFSGRLSHFVFPLPFSLLLSLRQSSSELNVWVFWSFFNLPFFMMKPVCWLKVWSFSFEVYINSVKYVFCVIFM